MQLPDNARQTLNETLDLIRETTPAEAAVKLRPDAWTLSEIVGHLIDTASNTHQRLVRLSFADLDPFPTFDGEPWIKAQNYAQADFTNLAVLFEALNEHLAHLIETLPESTANNTWQHPERPKTTHFLINEYFTHMADHMTHYAKRLAEVRAAEVEAG